WEGIEQGVADSGRAWSEITAVGLGAPGPVDPGLGLWWGSANLRLENPPLPLAEEMAARSGRPTFIENDVKAGGLGELHVGHGKALDPSCSFLFVSVGTGLAASLIVG